MRGFSLVSGGFGLIFSVSESSHMYRSPLLMIRRTYTSRKYSLISPPEKSAESQRDASSFSRSNCSSALFCCSASCSAFSVAMTFSFTCVLIFMNSARDILLCARPCTSLSISPFRSSSCFFSEITSGDSVLFCRYSFNSSPSLRRSSLCVTQMV